jgi:hypothetical protein
MTNFTNMLFAVHVIHVFVVYLIRTSYNKFCYPPRCHHREDISTSCHTGLPEYDGICRNMSALLISLTNIHINKVMLTLNKRFFLARESIIVNCPFIMNAQAKYLPSFFQESNPIGFDITHCAIQLFIY